MSETLTINIDDFNMRSSWTNRADGSYSNPSTATAVRMVTVYQLPDTVTIESANLILTCGSGYGGARVLNVNDIQLNSGQQNVVDFASLVTGNGEYTFTFKYQDYGVAGLSQGSHYGTMGMRDIALEIVYTSVEPTPVDPDEPGESMVFPESDSICLYSPNTEDFSDNGLGILKPISCIVTEEAGGQYEAELVLAADGELWQLIEAESIIRIPVPVMTLDAFNMSGAAYWKIKSNYKSAPVKSKVPTWERVSSTSGIPNFTYTGYEKGDKVVYNGQVYQYTGLNAFVFMSNPEETNNNWKNVGPTTQLNSGKTLATLARDEIFTKISDMNANWMRVKTANGIEGYLETKYAEYYSDGDSFVESREIRNQCFRVYRIEKDSHNMRVIVNCRHLSYDFAKTYLAKCEMEKVTVPTAISLIKSAALYEDNRQIFTDIDEDTVDLDCSWDNGITALLNPDTGIVDQLQARLIRDNEDFFILADNHTDRGFRIMYGKNLKAVRWSTDTSTMVTRVIPHCKDKDGEDLLLPEAAVDSPFIDDFPTMYVEALAVSCQEDKKGVVDGEEVEHLTKEQCYTIMRKAATDRFDVDHVDNPEVSIDIDMLMLGSTVEYKQYAELETLYMYDTVHIYHPILNMEIAAYMTGYEYDAILRRYNRIMLTNARRTQEHNVSGYDIRNNSIRFEKLSSTAIDRLRS